jgi:hypothetical protein
VVEGRVLAGVPTFRQGRRSQPAIDKWFNSVNGVEPTISGDHGRWLIDFGGRMIAGRDGTGGFLAGGRRGDRGRDQRVRAARPLGAHRGSEVHRDISGGPVPTRVHAAS